MHDQLTGIRMMYSDFLHDLHLGYTPAGEKAFLDLVHRYSEPHRCYHNIFHIDRMLLDLKRVEQAAHLVSSINLRWAIWYHDIVYKPGHEENEEISFYICEKAMKQFHFDSAQREIVKTYILATKQHVHQIVPVSADEPWIREHNLLLDLDMAVLGFQSEEYEQYAVGVKEEYLTRYSLAEFNQGRANFLKTMLDRGFHLFRHPVIQDLYGAQAGVNMLRELATLT